MRVKAFSLMEIIIVILIIGIVFSLVLSSYTTKKSDKGLLGIKDISAYISKSIPNANGDLYIYGKKCRDAFFITEESLHVKTPSFNFLAESIVLKQDIFENFVQIEFPTKEIEKRKKRVCFTMRFKDGKFFDKFIITSKHKHYLFSPFYQDIKTFSSLVLAKENYVNDGLYPQSVDDYYDK